MFPWDSTPRCAHLTPETLQIVPYFPDFSQFVLILGSPSKG